MTSTQQRAALQRQIWQIANDVRGAVDGWDFKQYVLGTLFYRFISENFASYIAADDESIDYAALPDSIITPAIKEDAIKTKGYFIYPSQLFATVVASAHTNESLNTDLVAIFTSIESSASGYPSEEDIKGLFADFDTTSNRLGNTVKDKNSRLAAVLKGVAGLDFGGFDGSQIDLFGDAYEFLISNYAANAGKSGGEFFTPQHVSRLIALAPNLFFGTTIAVNILVLSKHKPDTTTQFIDASGLFKKETNNNIFTDDHIDQIMQVFESKGKVDHFARSIPLEQVAANDYNLSVSSYVEAKDTREVVDIGKLNAELKTTVAKIDKLRAEIDAIVAEIEA
jgi:type I restriction-modification system DNA methylase subunit